jgi:hypothetical protein
VPNGFSDGQIGDRLTGAYLLDQNQATVSTVAERPGGGTMLTFHIEFEFCSKLLQSLMAALFEETAGRMVTAFKGRAKQLYGARRLRVPASLAAAVA